MTKQELWENWADPSGWCEYMEHGTPLEETKQLFFEDLNIWFSAEITRIASDALGKL